MLKLILNQILALAGTFLKNAFRSKGALGLILSGATLMMCTNIVANLYVGEKARILQSSGLFLLGIWGLVSAVYLGATVVNKEIQDKTIYMLLVRPMHRGTYLAGKWLGVVATLFALFCCVGGIFLLNITTQGIPLSSSHAIALGGIFLEWCLLGTFSLMFSTFTTPFLNGLFVYGIWTMGHLSNDLFVYYKNIEGEPHAIFIKLLHLILPNLETFNFRSQVIYGSDITAGLVSLSFGVALLWMFTLAMAAYTIFSLRKLP
ncbi:MAG: ABC transporter permease [Desulfobacterales bacterium]|nr:ABC transporter permease [Desulfobacterales bacterium]